MKYQLFVLVLLAVIFLLPTDSVHAQPNLRVNEPFDSNISGWKVGAGEGVASEIEDGQYQIAISRKGARFFATRQYYLEPESDYTLACDFRIEKDSTSGFFGMIWGAKSARDMYTLLVKDSLWSIKTYRGGKSKTIDQGTLSAKSDGKFTYKITRDEAGFKIMINDQEIYAGDVLPLVGNHIGFMAFDPIQVAIDQLTLETSSDLQVLTNLPIGLKKRNLGEGINTAQPEKLPVISPDGNYLFFTVRDSNDLDRVYVARRDKKGKWGNKKKMGWPVNVDSSSSGVFSVSSDNNTLFMNGQFENGVYVGKGISYLVREEAGWREPQNISIEDYQNEGKYVEHYLSADGKTLLHSLVDDRNSEGAYDLYVSFRLNDSIWSKPLNLGKDINTPADEISPFLAPDSRTLYFSTDGRKGFGSADVFVSRRMDDSWTNWSTPMNLGPDVNSAEWDGYYVVDARGTYAYFTSKAKSMGSTDIYQLPIPPVARPQPVLVVYGKVKDAESGDPVGATVTFRDLKTDDLIGIARSAPKNGIFKIVLPKGRHYSFEASHEGYFAIRDNLDVTELGSYKEMRKDLSLAPLKAGQNITLNNLFFDTGKASLREESTPELERVCELLKEYPEMQIEIAGHTDDVGDPDQNLSLSQKRAEAVQAYLLQCKIGSDRIQATGYGETQPLVENTSDQNRQRNRRVEFVISTF